jgi:hypothetical protein
MVDGGMGLGSSILRLDKRIRRPEAQTNKLVDRWNQFIYINKL